MAAAASPVNQICGYGRKAALLKAPEKPPALAVNFDDIPDELKAARRWLGWLWTWSGGRWTKPPVDVRDGRAGATVDATNPANCATFDEAALAYQGGGLDGIGYSFLPGDGLVGGDVDDCLDAEGTLSKTAEALLADLPTVTYTEVSPTGTGLKFVARGVLPHGEAIKAGAGELYSCRRYFAITGQRRPGSPLTVAACQGGLDRLRAALLASRPASTNGASVSGNGRAASSCEATTGGGGLGAVTGGPTG